MTMVPVENVAGRPQSMTSTRSLAGVAISDVTPLVFVVDDNVSVRESLELLIMSAGWQPRTFASAQEFLSRPHLVVPCCLVLDVTRFQTW